MFLGIGTILVVRLSENLEFKSVSHVSRSNRWTLMRERREKRPAKSNQALLATFASKVSNLQRPNLKDESLERVTI
jgi:hypothetical protein